MWSGHNDNFEIVGSDAFNGEILIISRKRNLCRIFKGCQLPNGHTQIINLFIEGTELRKADDKIIYNSQDPIIHIVQCEKTVLY